MKTLLLVLGGFVAAGVVFATAVLHRPREPGADILVITHGEEVDLARYLAAGKYTLFDFYAVWCPPCRALSPALERLAARRPETLAIRKVDIVDWTMPVAAQHRVESLPYLVLFDERGMRIADGEAVFEALTRIFGPEAREVDEAAGGQAPARPVTDAPGAGMPTPL
jgi:thioredoxin-like negative regulator of GroEL